jgi:hypothetical protein
VAWFDTGPALRTGSAALLAATSLSQVAVDSGAPAIAGAVTFAQPEADPHTSRPVTTLKVCLTYANRLIWAAGAGGMRTWKSPE